MRLLLLWRSVRTALPRVLPLLRSPLVPFWLKAATGVLAALIISPLDLFGDIPVIGFADDAALLALLATAFVQIAARLSGNRTAQSPQRVGPPALL